MLGIVSAQEALAQAEEQELDLVKISPNAVPPVCKIMDYGKFRFDQLKKEKEARKNQRVVEIKEIRMSPGIDTNDLNVKMRNAMKFLKEGNRVKVTVRFRGREMAHTDIGEQLLIRFGEGCAEVANVDKKPKLDGRFMTLFLSPKNARITTSEGEPPMPKMKTHTGAKKRFNLTKTGKVKRAHAFKSHILTKKTTKRGRGLRRPAYADVTNVEPRQEDDPVQIIG